MVGRTHRWMTSQTDRISGAKQADEATDGRAVTHLIQKLSKQRTRKAMGRPKPR